MRHYPIIRLAAAAAVASGLVAAMPAFAQSPPDTAPKVEPAPPPVDPKACGDGKRATTGSTDTPGQGLTAVPPGSTTSERLAATEGVICPPPEMDPEIRLRPPGGGTTPVIPPPGSPGGDPSNRPK